MLKTIILKGVMIKEGQFQEIIMKTLLKRTRNPKVYPDSILSQAIRRKRPMKITSLMKSLTAL